MSGDQDEPGANPEVGSVAEEAARLLGALSDWARDATHDVESHLATGGPECTYCPICRTVHVVRELSPEVKEQLATAATTALQAVSGLLTAFTADGPPARGGVEHIDLDDGPEDWPEEHDVRADEPSDEHTDPEEGDR